MDYQIQPLTKEKWQGHEIFFSDFADNCYDVKITHEQNKFSVLIEKQPLKKREIIKYPQKLFTTGYADVKAWGVFDGERLIAGVETGVESRSKSPRLYISLLWVDEDYRRKGIAAALISTAKKRAIDESFRAVFLETWSCNEHAVAFYLSQGFRLIGFDNCANSNEDVEKYNVPLKLGYFTE
jgi:ribosomal protein S18 acetylase RimI-like enzyme